MHPALPSRRHFLTASAGLAAASSFLARAQGGGTPATGKLKVGLVGCGGRGTGAAGQALKADKDAVLVAVADAFADKAKGALDGLKGKYPDQVEVKPEAVFVGLDGYKALIDMVDVVLLATPPGFRPLHLAYAVEKGRHIFAEKPVCVDAPGYRSAMESVKAAKEKKLSLVCGFCWRHHAVKRELFGAIHEGKLGEVLSAYVTYLTGPVNPIAPESQRGALTDLEWQLKYWQNFGWLSGDGYVEQCIHSVDKLLWAFQDETPVAAVANGGRHVAANGGNIFDHMSVTYEFKGGRLGHVGQRQTPNCYGQNADFIHGALGRAENDWNKAFILPHGGGERWRPTAKDNDMYLQEHIELFDSIRKGSARNDGEWLAHSSMVGVMGRMAAYTGKRVTWEEAIAAPGQLVGDGIDLGKLSFDMKLPARPLAIPGQSPLV